MLFNSLEFAIFLPIVFFLFWFAAKGRTRLQNLILLVSSCIFYMFLIPEYILVLFLAIIVDYFAGIWIERVSGPRRKLLLWLSVVTTCLILFVFKYYNFFIVNYNNLASLIGWNYSLETLKIVLPIGLSFHTFQSLSYVIDVYRNEQKAEKDFLTYSVYVMFFPQLVAGPIERAASLLPQFHAPKNFNLTMATDGVRQILWGLFTKCVIADSCALYVNAAFQNQNNETMGSLWLSACLFSIQIYGDFAGYSNMALGTAKLFGFKLMKNFDYPLFSRDIAEFWRRWHISLTTWFRDYVYKPLGGNKGSLAKTLRNTMIVFLISGFWHGANWTYVAWGAIHAVFLMPLLIMKKNRRYFDIVGSDGRIPPLREILGMAFTFIQVAFALIIFRSTDITRAFSYISGLFSFSKGVLPQNVDITVLILVIIFFAIEWFGRKKEHPLDIAELAPVQRRLIYTGVILMLCLFGVYNKSEFIYFQF
jgi:alginate O-acetyltransferase complex protein AlgI